MKTLNVAGGNCGCDNNSVCRNCNSISGSSCLITSSISKCYDDVMTTTTSVERGEQDAVSSTITTTNNNVSNTLLGRLFTIVDFETASVNPINETYIETSTVNNVTIVPPNPTTATTAINGTETANVTVDILPNGLSLIKGKALS
jgi:hypothetical protein